MAKYKLLTNLDFEIENNLSVNNKKNYSPNKWSNWQDLFKKKSYFGS